MFELDLPMHTIVQGYRRNVALFLSLIILTVTSQNLSGLVPYRNFLWFSDFRDKAEFYVLVKLYKGVFIGQGLLGETSKTVKN